MKKNEKFQSKLQALFKISNWAEWKQAVKSFFVFFPLFTIFACREKLATSGAYSWAGERKLNVRNGILYCIHLCNYTITFECYALNKFQWWSVGRFSLTFSSLLRISKKDGLLFISDAQHSSVNLGKMKPKKKN